MLYNYIALVFFSLFAIFIPASFLFTSWLLRDRVPSNPVKNAPYESGEIPIGNSRDIDIEYLPYFLLFIPFEIVAVFAIVWASQAQNIGFNSGLYILGLTIISMLLAFAGYKIISDKYV